MRRNLYLLFSLGLLSLPFLMAGCTPPPDPWKNAKPGQKRILVSFPPIYCVASAIVGDKAHVLSMLTTQGPHHYEGTPLDALKLNGADIYMYGGLSMEEGFNNQMLKNRRNAKLVEFDLGQQLLRKHPKLIPDLEKPIQHGDHTHNQDPHYWVGIAQVRAVTEIMAAKLSEIDNANAKHYEQGKTDFIKKLDELHAYGKAAFAKKKSRSFVTQHDSFRYFVKKENFDLQVFPIQVRPGLDSNAVEFATLRDTMEKEGVRVIAIEPQYSPAQAETLRESLKRKNIDIKIITLDPLETAPRMGDGDNPDPEFYLKKMRENIDKLAEALP